MLSLFGLVYVLSWVSFKAALITQHFKARTEDAYLAAPAREGPTIVSSVPAPLVYRPAYQMHAHHAARRRQVGLVDMTLVCDWLSAAQKGVLQPPNTSIAHDLLKKFKGTFKSKENTLAYT